MNCKNCNNDFTIYPQDKEFYQKIDVPEPTWCPDCRLMRKLAWRNERNLYQRKCDATGKTIVSLFQADSSYIVYGSDYWRSDKWDPLDYAQEFDFSRGFFEQVEELFKQVPRIGILSQARAINCDYCSSTSGKNCYLCFLWYGNDCLYSTWGLNNESTVDVLHISISEICYELTDAEKCYNVMFAHQSHYCWDSVFLFDCRGCSNCFGGTNLRNRSFVFFNQQLTEKEYQKKMSEVNLGDYQQLKKYQKKYQKLKSQAIYRDLDLFQAINCQHSEYIHNCKNCGECFDIVEVQDVRYGYNLGMVKDGMDITFLGINTELAYECVGGGIGGYNLKFCETVRGSTNMEYSAFCENCRDCFACAGLRNKKFCILNKQYSKKEYKELVGKIKKYALAKGEYGEFFPLSMAWYPYNDTNAQVIFPKTKEEVEKMGSWWQEVEKRKDYPNQILAQDLPNHIKDVKNDILDKTIICEKSGKGFKIIKQELEFYKKYNLSLPRRHPEVRHEDRLAQRRQRKFAIRKCSQCEKEVESTIPQSDPRKVYCEKCYRKEIY